VWEGFLNKKVIAPYASDKMKQILRKHGIYKVEISAEVGDGWLPLIDRLLEKLETFKFDGGIAQIKEKFGGLRFYPEVIHVTGGKEQEDYIFNAIAEAEKESFKTCEYCGSTKDVETKAWNSIWIKSLCQDCGNKKASEIRPRKRRK
jgi:hypothetical protein